MNENFKNNPQPVDWESLGYYDDKLKEYIEAKIQELKDSLNDFSDKDYVEEKFNDLKAELDRNNLLDSIQDEKISNLESDISRNSEDIKILVADDKILSHKIGEILSILGSKIDRDELSNLATKDSIDLISERLDDQALALSEIHDEVDSIQANLSSYITEDDLYKKDYITKSEASTIYVTEKAVLDMIDEEVTSNVSEQLSKNEKIRYGTFGVI